MACAMIAQADGHEHETERVGQLLPTVGSSTGSEYVENMNELRRWITESRDGSASRLEEIVRAHLPDMTPKSRRLALAAAGLLAVANAARDHASAEEQIAEQRTRANRDSNREVLDALVEITAADGDFTADETEVLRSIATALGLSQKDYDDFFFCFREKARALGR
jgi:tellurite resistance protein